ncbi:MAG: hypothetical protein HYU80_01795 [Candidatus Blackburnbacteria bacterium]|nr:hypothetical protein [Candidatus Blackburnbacteria bacterium]
MKNVFHDITRHMPHYLSLFGIVGLGCLGLIVFSYDQGFRMAVTVALGAAFVAWGVVHHWLHDDLHFKIVLEYLFTAILGVIVLLSLI